MEERKKETILKSNNPEKLVVFNAKSFDNEIRFYVTNSRYITAIDLGDGKVEVERKIEKSNGVEDDNTKKKNLKKIFIEIIFLILSACILTTFITYKFKDNLDIVLLVNIIVLLMYLYIFLFIVRFKNTSKSLKSKHSAEHMMVNFLEINKRLPKNIQEIKSVSRFSKNCGDKRITNEILEKFLKYILATFMIITYNNIYPYFKDNNIIKTLEGLIPICIFLFSYFILGKILLEKLDFIIKPLRIGLLNIFQCATTTSKVRDLDILIAYCVAREWMKIVYPEFYNQEEDVFLNEYL